MKIYTKELLIKRLEEIKELGWVASSRKVGNAGAVGNVLETLLGIQENNLPIANAAEWELKAQRKDTTSLTTLFHFEPSPRKIRFVSRILLPVYGWSHSEAGNLHSVNEMSFRQTLNAIKSTDRGFKIQVDRNEQKISISFDYRAVEERHLEWLKTVETRVGLAELNPQPYWGFEDIFHKAGTKLANVFYVLADRKVENNVEFFHYNTVVKLTGLDKDRIVNGIEQGDLFIDFDARSGHNHGTKFRIIPNKFSNLYNHIEVVI